MTTARPDASRRCDCLRSPGARGGRDRAKFFGLDARGSSPGPQALDSEGQVVRSGKELIDYVLAAEERAGGPLTMADALTELLADITEAARTIGTLLQTANGRVPIAGGTPLGACLGCAPNTGCPTLRAMAKTSRADTRTRKARAPEAPAAAPTEAEHLQRLADEGAAAWAEILRDRRDPHPRHAGEARHASSIGGHGMGVPDGPRGSTATDPPWARLPSESSKAFSCFQRYPRSRTPRPQCGKGCGKGGQISWVLRTPLDASSLGRARNGFRR